MWVNFVYMLLPSAATLLRTRGIDEEAEDTVMTFTSRNAFNQSKNVILRVQILFSYVIVCM